MIKSVKGKKYYCDNAPSSFTLNKVHLFELNFLNIKNYT